MTFKRSFVIKKLEQIARYTQELKELLDTVDDRELRVPRNLHVAERLVQLVTDAMIDINQHFIRELNFEIPDDLQSTFKTMGDNGVLPKEFAYKISP